MFLDLFITRFSVESGGVSKIQGSVSLGEGGVSILTGILDGPTGVTGRFLLYLRCRWRMVLSGRSWRSCRYPCRFRIRFTIHSFSQTLNTVVIADPIRPLFDSRAK